MGQTKGRGTKRTSLNREYKSITSYNAYLKDYKGAHTYIQNKKNIQRKALFRLGKAKIISEHSLRYEKGGFTVKVRQHNNRAKTYTTYINDTKINEKLKDRDGAIKSIYNYALSNFNGKANNIKSDLTELLMDPNITSDGIKTKLTECPIGRPIVGSFYYGGEAKSLGGINIFEVASGQNVYLTGTAHMQIKDNYIDNISGASIYILCAIGKSELGNSIFDKGKFSFENSASVVSLWSAGTGKYLFTGDSTVDTMVHLNNLYKKLDKDSRVFYEAPNVMTAPHHGSDLTSRGKFSSNGQNKWEIYSQFLNNYKPQGVAISAGYGNKHGHPGCNFLDTTYCYLKNSKVKDHSIYANLNKSVSTNAIDYGLYKTEAPIYSTLEQSDKILRLRLLQYKDRSHQPEEAWSNIAVNIPDGVTEVDSSTTDCTNIKTKQSPFDYRKSNKNSSKSPAASADRPRAIKRGRAS